MKYKIFKFTSKNTGHYFADANSLLIAQRHANRFPHTRIDGPDGFFQEFEKGFCIAWSTVVNGFHAPLIAIHDNDALNTPYIPSI